MVYSYGRGEQKDGQEQVSANFGFDLPSSQVRFQIQNKSKFKIAHRSKRKGKPAAGGTGERRLQSSRSQAAEWPKAISAASTKASSDSAQ